MYFVFKFKLLSCMCATFVTDLITDSNSNDLFIICCKLFATNPFAPQLAPSHGSISGWHFVNRGSSGAIE